MKDFRQLKVWEKAHVLTLAVYRNSKDFPKEEIYGLTSQMKRSASSIPTNIAEGCGRGSDADFARFMQMAMGSACELQYQLILSRDLEYLTAKQYLELEKELSEVQRMLTTLIKKLNANS
jgi:four helix bundle protein